MEFEQFKSAWQNRSAEGQAFPSRSLQFVRTSAIHDLQHSDAVSRLVFDLLFALLAIGASIVAITAQPARIAVWLFAAALLFDTTVCMSLLGRKTRKAGTATMVEFISREHRQIQNRVRIERYSQGLTIILAAAALLTLLLLPHSPGTPRENALDALQRMAVLTGFLAVAWRRAKSRSREIRRELEQYLNELHKANGK